MLFRSEIASLLSALNDTDECPKTIIYSLNPADDAQIGTILGCFQNSEVPGKIQHGSAWWFNDHKIGMEEQMSRLASLGLLGNFGGRNAKSYTSAKNATIGDYRRATGFEALMGYLYLDGQYDRLTKLVHTGLEAIGEWEHHRMEKK